MYEDYVASTHLVQRALVSGGVIIYNISWGLNHQRKLLVELVHRYGIRSQRDKRSRIRISTTLI